LQSASAESEVRSLKHRCLKYPSVKKSMPQKVRADSREKDRVQYFPATQSTGERTMAEHLDA
jgi:hypothetical protein